MTIGMGQGALGKCILPNMLGISCVQWFSNNTVSLLLRILVEDNTYMSVMNPQ